MSYVSVWPPIGARSLLVPEDFQRHNHFNLIRMAMAILVIWSHSFALYYGTEDFEPISLLLNGTYNAGNVGVRVFFLVSGFLITYSFLRSGSLVDYLRKRIARIFPGFLVCVPICAFIVVPLFSTRVDLTPGAVSCTMFNMLHLTPCFPASDVFAGNPAPGAVNGSLWSIRYEFWCYLGVAAAGLTTLLARGRGVLLAALLAIIAVKFGCDLLGKKPMLGIIGAIIGWPYLWLSVAPSFLAGMLVYLYRERLPRSGWLALCLLAMLVVAAHVSQLLADAMFPFVAAYATFYVAFLEIRLPDAARYGDFSYGTYLYAYPIQQMLVGATLPFFLYVPLAIILSVAAGAASWFLVEKPFLPRKRVKAITGPDAPADVAAAH